MSHNSYSRCWLHLVWATHARERLLPPGAAVKVSDFLTQYARDKGLYMKINFVNADHVHTLIDLPTNMTIEDAAQLFKGASSHWINSSNLIRGKFAWGKGYGAFSVSQSDVARVAEYISDQAEHHRTKSFAEEYERFVKVYGLVWRGEETVKTVSASRASVVPSLKRGVNEKRSVGGRSRQM
ncbi:MAG TPA: IS200/IS605 family transposase [Verrucomicrobiae bacterium]|nr:IS200/IS605 family transposase [Verrucomicrobiae bacterium]